MPGKQKPITDKMAERRFPSALAAMEYFHPDTNERGPELLMQLSGIEPMPIGSPARLPAPLAMISAAVDKGTIVILPRTATILTKTLCTDEEEGKEPEEPKSP